MPDKRLIDSLLAGLKQENAQPDAADDRFMQQAMALTDEDMLTDATPGADGDDDGEEDEDEGDDEEDDDEDDDDEDDDDEEDDEDPELPAPSSLKSALDGIATKALASLVTKKKDSTGHEHAPAGSSAGGQFTSGGGGGEGKGGDGDKDKPKSGKPAEKDGKEKEKEPSSSSSDKSKFIGASVGGAEHKQAHVVAGRIAAAVGGKVEEEVKDVAGQRDKKPFDVRAPKRGGGFNDIEVKSMLKGGKTAISVHEDALLRKVEHMQKNPQNTFHTVVADERGTYEGGQHADKFSGHALYYRRGSGRYSLASMYKVKDEAELKRLINTPDDKLPEAARGELPPPPPLQELKQKAEAASQSRKARDKKRKAANKDVLREQARARAAAKRTGGGPG